VGSAILYTWGTKTHYTDQAGQGSQAEVPTVEIKPSKNIDPGTATVTWDDGGSTKTANDDGFGNITGDATGRIIYSGTDRVVRIKPTSLPDSTVVYQLDYDEPVSHSTTENVSNANNSGTLELTLANTPIRPGTVSVRVPMVRLKNGARSGIQDSGTKNVEAIVVDDTNGNMTLDGNVVGSVDYSSGDVSIDPRRDYDREVYRITSAPNGNVIASA